jgi:galactose mutarotase-like enzyme
VPSLIKRAPRRPPVDDPLAGYAVAELRGGGSRVVIVPALGGKIAALELGGRQWLWRSDVIPFRPGTDGASYVETADSGGYDECFPTVGACVVPDAAGRYGGLTLPDHGELWAQRAETDVVTLPDGPQATSRWRGRRMPYEFARSVRVGAAGEVAMRYAVRNDGKEPLPFIWSAHPLLPLTPDTRLVLPDGARVRVYAQHKIDLGGPGAEHWWPRATLAKSRKVVDLSRPDAVARRYACKLFLDMPTGAAAVEEAGSRLEVRFDVAAVPNLGLWLNRRGWTPFRGRSAYCNFAFEPCIGATDLLSDAVGSSHGARWLEPGEEQAWTLEWRGSRG